MKFVSVRALVYIWSMIHLAILVFSSHHDYKDALSKSILFFEGQRSGPLPEDQRMRWRGDSGLEDGKMAGVDLTGGYHDAGDNVKFHFPMAFTTTMLAWSVIEFGTLMPSNELKNALVAIKWGADYLLKTTSQLPHKIHVQVGDPISDHDCWERPEDMDTVRMVYTVDAPSAASEVAGETAAALAASSKAFASSDPEYSARLLKSAIAAFQYADNHRGAYSDDPKIVTGACPFYCDVSGYQDELFWGAAWLWRATQDKQYLDYIEENGQKFGAFTNIYEFGWDNKHAGLLILLTKEVPEGSLPSLQKYNDFANCFMCSLVPQSSSSHIKRSPGGLIYKPGGSNMQHVTSLSFLMLVYANHLTKTNQTIDCGNVHAGPNKLRRLARKQVDYVLGDNPMGMSYMVGYGLKFPQKIHHRGSSTPSLRDHPEFIGCQEGYTRYFDSPMPNLNLLVGAVVGGPGVDDLYNDSRVAFVQSEPTTYINAPFVGVLAYCAANP
ncbi:Endoglucanase 24-like protein [Drosera capensis]